jgi:hypothetical protein
MYYGYFNAYINSVVTIHFSSRIGDADNSSRKQLR